MTIEPGLRVVSICGSLRAKSYNGALLKALPALAPGSMSFVEGASIANLPHYDFDLQQLSGPAAAAVELGAAIREAEGVVIVSPEYNYSVPGVLKNAIDWLSRLPQQPFKDKPVSHPVGVGGPARRRAHAISLAPNSRVARCAGVRASRSDGRLGGDEVRRGTAC